MLFSEKTIRLKDGRSAFLRAPRPVEDAQELVDYLLITAQETEFVLRYPEECTLTAEDEQAFLQAANDSSHTCMIVCEVDGEVAGTCHLKCNSRLKIRHRAEVGIALRQKFWGLGIGTALFKELIALARERQVEQLELNYVEGNERARGLYEKMGFQAVAVHPNAFRLKDGSTRAEIRMIRQL